MELSSEKCKVMHFGRLNRRANYTMIDNSGRTITLATTSREKDLGIIITPDLKWHEQVCHASSNANRVLGRLKNTFTTRDEKLWTQLYKVYVRPHLEFAVSAWCPYQRGDIRIMERVQQRATRIALSGSRREDYDSRCKRLGIQKSRRRRGELIQFFKIQKALDRVCWSKNLLLVPPRVEGKLNLDARL